MKSMVHQFSCARSVVLLWVSVWMLAVPLFHVHPDADDRHGEAGHIHGGTVHTVLSRELDCQFDWYEGIHGPGANEHHGTTLSARQVHRGNEHPEFTFSLLSESTDRKPLKPCLTQVFGISSTLLLPPDPENRIECGTYLASPSPQFSHDIRTRAPPLLLL